MEKDTFARDFLAYSRMIAQIEKADPDIKFLGVEGHTVGFEKNGKKFNHALMTWQCAPDPTRPGITEKDVANMVIESMKDY